jgi:hypothetical protein
LLHILHGFLRRTLVSLALAIIGLVFADILNAWVVTAWIARLLIILAGYRLWRNTYAVVREPPSRARRARPSPTPTSRRC